MILALWRLAWLISVVVLICKHYEVIMVLL